MSSFFLLQTVCHKHCLSATNSKYLSQTVHVCYRQYVSLTASLFQSETLFLIVFGRHHHLIVHDFCPDLSVIFEFVRHHGALDTHFVDPGTALHGPALCIIFASKPVVWLH